MVNKLVRKDKTKKSKGFVYKGRSADVVKKIAEESGGRFDSILKSGVDTFTPAVGENVVRILPPTWDNEYFGLSVWVHSRIGEDNSTYLCLKKMKGKDCPICAAAKEAKDDGEEDEAKALRNNERYLYYVINRKDKEPSPQVWNASWTQNREIAGACRNIKSGRVLLIDHPDEGYDLSFRRTGQGLKTKYGAPQVDRDKCPISDDDKEQDEILETIESAPLPSLLNYYDAEYLEKVLSGGSAKKDEELDDDDDDGEKKPSKRRKSDDDDEDEDEKPAKKKKRPADDDEEEDEKPTKRRRGQSEDEDESDDNGDDGAGDEDEEEDAKPSRDKKSRRGSSDDDDEDEDEKPKRRGKKDADEDEEDDADEKPKRRAKDDDEDEEDEKPKSRRRAADDDEEDDEDEKPKGRRGKKADDDDDDATEDEKPRRRSKARDEDDDEAEVDDTGEEDDEDEKPRKSTRVKLKK